jgi:hypothetical protein
MEIEKGRTSAKVILIVCTSFFGLLAIPDLILCFLSVFFFDSPASTSHGATWLFAYSIWSYIFIYIVAVAVGWGLFAAKKYTAAKIIVFLPVINLLIALNFILFVGTF